MPAKKKVKPAASSNGWSPDHKAETVLKDLGIPFKIASVKISDIDWKQAEKNPARSDRALDEGLVEDYVTSMKDGQSFPYPIMISNKGKFYPPAGMHRTVAAQRSGRKEIMAYIPTKVLTPYQERMIAVMSNRKEGKRASRAEAYAYAVSLVMDNQLNETEVSRNLGVDSRTLNAQIRAEKTKRKAMEAGSTAQLPQTTWGYLNQIASNENVLVAASVAINGLALPPKEIITFIRDIKKGRNESDTLQRINKYMKNNKDIITKPKGRIGKESRARLSAPNRDQFFRKLRDLKLHVQGKNLKTMQIAKGSPEHKKAKSEVKETFALVLKSLK